jgi:hypothetical protein
VTGFGQPTREARSYRAVSLLFVSCCRSRTTTSRPKKLESLRRPGERGLAQSGRPRRAKGRRTASRGGKTVDSSTRKAGARKGIAGLSASSRWKASRVVEAVLSSRGEWGKRSRPSWCSSSRERDGQTSEATETSEVGRSKIKFRIHAPMRWRKPTAGSASGSPKRMERRETHQAPASIGRKLGAQSVTERSARFSKGLRGFGIHRSCASLIAQPRGSKDVRAVRPSFGRTRRTVDAAGGGGRSERVHDARSGVESRAGVHIRGRKVSVERHDGRRSGCGNGHP